MGSLVKCAERLRVSLIHTMRLEEHDYILGTLLISHLEALMTRLTSEPSAPSVMKALQMLLCKATVPINCLFRLGELPAPINLKC
jgi:hypothetical protein